MGSSGLRHRAVACLTALAFAVCMIGCSRTVTKYDQNGKPYTDTEFDPWGTIGGLILTGLALTAIALAAESHDSKLPLDERNLLAYAKAGDTASDALPMLTARARWIEVLDPQGNLVSRHLMRTDRLARGEELVNPAEIQLSSEINEQVLKQLMKEFAELQGTDSIPKAMKVRLAVLDRDEARLQIKSVELAEDNVSGSGIAKFLMSPLGVFRVDASGTGTGEIEVTLSQLN